MKYELTDKVALVTGASRGIGAAIAAALVEAGASVALHYHEHVEGARELAEAIETGGGKVCVVQSDVSKHAEVRKMVDAVTSKLGPVEILVNNAGVAHKAPLDELTEEDWDRVLAVNLKSAFLVTQACLPAMRGARWGRIINISSVAAQTGGVTGPIYCASKAGMMGLTHSYAALLVKEGITANTITPALIETDMTRSLGVSPDPIPVGRFGHVDEISDVVVMLARNGYLTGQTINVNGGWYFS